MARLPIRCLLLATVALTSSAARADTVNIASSLSVESTGAAFTGELSVTQIGATQDYTISLLLRNTTPTSVGGFITAFALNNPGNISTVNSFASTNANFGLLGVSSPLPGTVSDNGVNAAPLGLFDFGASTGNSWEGGGNPSEGIPTGIAPTNEATFTIEVSLSSGSLTAAGLLSALSSGATFLPFEDLNGYGIGVRFRGLEDGGSDKVPGYDGEDPPDPRPVPAPPALVLGAIGAIGLFGRRAWNRRKTAELAA